MKILDSPASGSLRGDTHSRNRFGQYVRTRATPVNPNSSAQGAARARLALNSAAWRTLTGAQRAGWSDLGLSMIRTDSLGQTVNLTGIQAYCSVNGERLTVGDAVVADAPALVTPSTIATVTITLTAAAFSLAYTPTPLGTGIRLLAFCSPQRSAGRNFESDYRLIAFSTAAQASPLVLTTAYTAKFGVPIVGNRIFLSLQTYDRGFLSGPLYTSQVVA